MKTTLPLACFTLMLLGAVNPVWAQVYRCAGEGGSAPEYINNAKDAQARNCKLVSGGNVTVMQGTAVPGTSLPKTAPAAPRTSTGPATATPRPAGGAEQQARDSDSRGILESELKKAEAKLAEQQKEYNNGEPEKQGIEGRNYQRYLDRVQSMKEGIVRSQSDIAGLKREIARLPVTNN